MLAADSINTLGTDVERDEQQVFGPLAECVQEKTGLARGPRTELDQHARAAESGDVLGALDANALLCSRRIVLLQPGDLFEEQAALLVVEPSRRQGGWVGRQPFSHVLDEALVRRWTGLGDAGVLDRHDRANRRPENAQRAEAGKKLR